MPVRSIGWFKHYMLYIVGSFGWNGGDFREIEREYAFKFKIIEFEIESVLFYMCIVLLSFYRV